MSTSESTNKIPVNELDFGSESSESSEEIVVNVNVNINTKPKNEINVVKKSIFLDADEESDDDELDEHIKTKISKPIKKTYKPVKKNVIPCSFPPRPVSDYLFADAETYSFKSWGQCFPNNKVSLRSLVTNPAWNEFFDIVEQKPYFKGMERILSDYVAAKKETILPYAELTFNSLNVLSPHQIKVVITGQDPYFNVNKINDVSIPQAMGFSFSVPKNYPKPPSLQNIYKNLEDFGHVKKKPESGCLAYWVAQGCFMINAAFTTFFGKPNAHKDLWRDFTNDLLAYVNTKCENIVFLVWGAFAHNLCINIDPYKHHIITSSHPSPLAVDKTFNGYIYGKSKNPRDRKPASYSSFKSTDHFGRVNTYLASVNKPQILWDLF